MAKTKTENRTKNFYRMDHRIKSFLIAIAAISLISCDDDGCTTCTFTYASETTLQEEDWCDGETMDDINNYYLQQEGVGTIEGDWECN